MNLRRWLGWVVTPDTRVFLLTLVYYLSLYFSINNRSLLIFSLLYFLLLWLAIKNLKLALFLTFLATLLFAKGKGFQIILLPKEQITRWALFKISYFFPLYLSDVPLFLLGYLYLRDKMFGSSTVTLPSLVKLPLVLLSLFTSWVALSSVGSFFPEVVLLSAVQLVRMMVVFFVFIMVGFDGRRRQATYSVVAAVILFESFWVFLQRFHGGPLGRDIEVFLPGAEFGIRSSENQELLRVSGTFFEPSIMGAFILMHITLLMTAFLGGRIMKSLKQLALSVVAAGSLALVFTGSRVLYGFWMLSAVFLWRVYRKRFTLWRRQFSARLPLGRMVLIGVLATLIISPYLIARLTSLPDIFTAYGSGTYRLQMMQYAARLFVSAPLTGVGINLSPYYFATGFSGERFVFDPTFPHNLFFQILAETGAVGFGLFFLFVAAIFCPLLAGRKLNEFGAAALVYLLAAQVYPIFLNHQEVSSFFFLYAGAFLASLKEHYA